MRDRNGVPQILRDWFDRRNGGESLDAENYLREHAGRADDLAQRLEALQALECALTESFGLPEGPPEAIGEYRIIRELGRGGMGVVYEAEQVSMQRRVALKLLTPVFTGSRTAVQRFHREARAAGRLHHTNIVPVYGLGTHGEYLYYTMELVEGQSLGDFIKDLRAAGIEGDTAHFHRVAEMFAGVAEALDVVHQEGVIHRDVKPANLLLDGDGTLKIVDFGMARLDEAPSMTLPGEFLGTPTYMSPEQAKARQTAVDHRTDIYSLGATLDEALILRPPFEGESILEIRAQIIAEDPTPPIQRNRHVPRDLSTVVLKAMEKEPGDRYPTAGAMARDLRRFVDGVPIQARPLGFVERAWRKVKRHRVRSSLAAVIALLVVVGLVFAIQSSRNATARRDLEYHQLLVRGEEAGAASMSSVVKSEWKSPMYRDDTARDYFTRAIELIPERLDAYWLRSLAPGRTLDERLADIVAARERGLSARTERFLRAYLICARKPSKAIEAREDVKSLEPQTAVECYAKARVLEAEGRKQEPIEFLDRAVRSAGRGTLIHYLALRCRASIHKRRGDVEAALKDLLAVQALGDDRVSVRIGIASLWNKLGSNQGAAEFEKALRQTQIVGAVAAWKELCRSCNLNQETGWLDRASARALEAHREDPGVLFCRAVACNSADRAEAAMELCDRILAAHPKNHSAHKLRGILLEKREDYSGALREYDLALDTAPNCRLCLALRGMLLTEKLDKHERALADFDRAIERSPHNALFVLRRALALFRLDRLKEALSASQRSIELDATEADTHCVQALILKKLNRHDEARTAFEAAIELDGTASRYLTYGKYLSDSGYFEEARDACKKAVSLDSKFAMAYYNMGVYLERLNQPEKALRAYTKALELDPTDGKARYNQAVAWNKWAGLLVKQGRLKEALGELNKALTKHGHRAYLYLHKADVLHKLKRFDDARAAYDEAIRRKPKDAKALNSRCNFGAAHFYRGVVLVHLEQLEEALADFKLALKMDQASSPARQNVVVMLNRLRKHDEAAQVLERGLRSYPKDAGLLWRLVTVRSSLQDHEGALDAANRALALEGSSDSNLARRALILVDLGRLAAARADLEKAEEANPKSTYVAWCRQEILLRTGDYRGALAAAGAARKSITALKYALVRVTCFRGLGRDDDASKIAARAIAGDDPPRDKRLEFAYLCAAAGDRKRAESFLEAWDLPWQPDDLYERARIHAVLGDKKAALEWLERAADKGLKRSAKLPPDPDFKALEDAPQYQGLLKKIRF